LAAGNWQESVAKATPSSRIAKTFKLMDLLKSLAAVESTVGRPHEAPGFLVPDEKEVRPPDLAR
jgi:hypothetical protein